MPNHLGLLHKNLILIVINDFFLKGEKKGSGWGADPDSNELEGKGRGRARPRRFDLARAEGRYRLERR